MRIVIAAISFCEYIIQQANSLAALGHEVLFVLPSPLIRATVGDALESLLHERVAVLACDEQRPWKRGYYQYPLREISRFDPDVIHVHENGEMLTFALMLRFWTKPTIVTIHDVTLHPGADSLMKSRRKIIRMLLRRRANVIHVHGVAPLRKFKHLHPGMTNKVRIIPHGTLSLFTHWANEKVGREALTCLFFGRMEKYRGLDNLMLVGEGLKKTLPGVRIVVAGRGTELEKFKVAMEVLGIFEIHDRFIPNSEVHRFFRRASCVLMPYHEASQSGIVAMALPFGVPIVATNVGAICETVHDGIHGRIVPVGDMASFIEATVDILTKRQRWMKMAEACINLSRSLSFESLAPSFEKLYRQAIGSAA